MITFTGLETEGVQKVVGILAVREFDGERSQWQALELRPHAGDGVNRVQQ
jgi:hypothetical protein